MKKIHYVQEMQIKEEALQSNITIIETEDPIRIKEFKRLIYSEYNKSYSKKVKENPSELAEILGRTTGEEKKRILEEVNAMQRAQVVTDVVVYDMFEGPHQLLKGEIKGDYNYPEASAGSITQTKGFDLPSFIKHINAKLKGEGKYARPVSKTILVITGIKNTEDIKQWHTALDNWAYSKIWDVEMGVSTPTGSLHARNHIYLFAPTIWALPPELIQKSIVVIPPLSTPDERRKLFRAKMAKNQGMYNIDPLLEEPFVNSSSGLNLHEVESTILASLKYFDAGVMKNPIDLEAVNLAKKEYIEKSGILTIEDELFGFERIGGYDKVKKLIDDNVIKRVKNPKAARKFGLETPGGYVLMGPPGTGKTLFAKATAKATGLPLVVLDLPKILNSMVGESEKSLARAIKILKTLGRVIIFIDEIDKLGGRGESSEITSTGGTTFGRLFSMILEYLGDEERESIIIATTNVPEKLDSALIRSGRISTIVPMLYPNEQARREIFDVHTNIKRVVPIEEGSRERIQELIIQRTNLCSGADIEEIIERAANKAFLRELESNKEERVEYKDFLDAVEAFNIPEIREEEYERFKRNAKKLCTDSSFEADLREEYVASQ